jgi:Acetyltransferase (isoleucine patch superfamily)
MNIRFAIKNYRHWLKRLLLRNGGGKVSIGSYTYGQPLVRWWGEPANLSIGKFCSIADDVQIFLGGNHRIDWITTYPFSVSRHWIGSCRIEGHPRTRGDVNIGHDVWLGSGCVILSGVSIGDGAVIGCRAVVSRDVPAYAIVAGNPGRVMRFRFPPDQIHALIESAWWNWEPAEIRAYLKKLLSPDVAAFRHATDLTHDRS